MDLILRYFPLALLLLLLWVLVRQHAHRAFPWFFVYVVFAVAAGVARLAVQSNRHALYLTFWVTDAGYALLGALALYEVLRKMLRLLARFWWTYWIFPALVAIGAGLSIWRMHVVPPQVHDRLLLWIVTGEIAVRFVQVFAVLLILIPLFGSRGHRHSLGISAGFGLYSTVALLITTRLSDIGTRFTFLWGVISLVAYSVAVLIWIWTFSAQHEEEMASPAPWEVDGSVGDLRSELGPIKRDGPAVGLAG
jgi:hypothetical protein